MHHYYSIILKLFYILHYVTYASAVTTDGATFTLEWISARLSQPGSKHVESTYKDKGKTVPLQAWTGPQGSRRSKLPGSQPYAPAAFTPPGD
jgi:hypothetical protein